jgi:GAF domain-containing protein
MSARDDLGAAVAAGVLGSEQAHRPLLQSIVDVAMAIFGARAASIMLYDAATEELVFEAAAGEGAGGLAGRRLPAGSGIAGWVLASQEPIVIEDVTRDPRFDRDAAEATGYVPKGLMSVPLLRADRALGVLNVLDRPARARFSLAEMELLGLFANQAALALDVVQAGRRTRELLEGGSGDGAALSRLAARLEQLEPERRTSVVRLIDELDRLLD